MALKQKQGLMEPFINTTLMDRDVLFTPMDQPKPGMDKAVDPGTTDKATAAPGMPMDQDQQRMRMAAQKNGVQTEVTRTTVLMAAAMFTEQKTDTAAGPTARGTVASITPMAREVKLMPMAPHINGMLMDQAVSHIPMDQHQRGGPMDQEAGTMARETAALGMPMVPARGHQLMVLAVLTTQTDRGR